MDLSVISLNFKNAPVELREQLAVVAEPTPALLRELHQSCGLAELMVLSTCNRMEFYFTGEDGTGGKKLQGWLAERCGAEGQEFSKSAITLSGRAAVAHLFRVACSLESMVIGEPQILGQVKEAYQLSVANGAQGPLLKGIMPRVLHTAKRVRSETQVARYPVSVSYVAVQLASRIFESLEDKSVLVVGAGDMAELTVIHLLKAGISRIAITNRTFSNAVSLAERFRGSAVRFEDLASAVAEADIVLTSTGAKEPIITPELARKAARKRRGAPIFFIDIAVPRDVHPEVNELADVYCYDIDDLQAVTDANKEEREREALQAQKIVEEEILRYEEWRKSLVIVPSVRALRRHFETVGEQELDKSLKKLRHLSSRDSEEVRRLVRSVLNKLLHTPSVRLRQQDDNTDGMLYGEVLNNLFALQQDSEDSQETAAATGDNLKEAAGNILHLPVTHKK
ncbi:MAG: glutamyl-tRNA reductase [SAR324 cluster bacterium]|nr:glutamyl-tRNA reductase [SAR324 cluster bacterium]